MEMGSMKLMMAADQDDNRQRPLALAISPPGVVEWRQKQMQMQMQKQKQKQKHNQAGIEFDVDSRNEIARLSNGAKDGGVGGGGVVVDVDYLHRRCNRRKRLHVSNNPGMSLVVDTPMDLSRRPSNDTSRDLLIDDGDDDDDDDGLDDGLKDQMSRFDDDDNNDQPLNLSTNNGHHSTSGSGLDHRSSWKSCPQLSSAGAPVIVNGNRTHSSLTSSSSSLLSFEPHSQQSKRVRLEEMVSYIRRCSSNSFADERHSMKPEAEVGAKTKAASTPVTLVKRSSSCSKLDRPASHGNRHLDGHGHVHGNVHQHQHQHHQQQHHHHHRRKANPPYKGPHVNLPMTPMMGALQRQSKKPPNKTSPSMMAKDNGLQNSSATSVDSHPVLRQQLSSTNTTNNTKDEVSDDDDDDRHNNNGQHREREFDRRDSVEGSEHDLKDVEEEDDDDEEEADEREQEDDGDYDEADDVVKNVKKKPDNNNEDILRRQLCLLSAAAPMNGLQWSAYAYYANLLQELQGTLSTPTTASSVDAAHRGGIINHLIPMHGSSPPNHYHQPETASIAASSCPGATANVAAAAAAAAAATAVVGGAPSPGSASTSGDAEGDIAAAASRKRAPRALTGKHVKHGTGASPATLLTLRQKIEQRRCVGQQQQQQQQQSMDQNNKLLHQNHYNDNKNHQIQQKQKNGMRVNERKDGAHRKSTKVVVVRKKVS